MYAFSWDIYLNISCTRWIIVAYEQILRKKKYIFRLKGFKGVRWNYPDILHLENKTVYFWELFHKYIVCYFWKDGSLEDTDIQNWISLPFCLFWHILFTDLDWLQQVYTETYHRDKLHFFLYLGISIYQLKNTEKGKKNMAHCSVQVFWTGSL